MSKPITITATRAVWINQYHTPAELLSYLERGEHGRIVDIVSVYGSPDMDKFGDTYTRIGEADVTLRLLPRDEQTKLAVQALQQKLDQLRAAYMAKQQEIMDQISRMQAIEYVSEA
jgi:hypothetical protein